MIDAEDSDLISSWSVVLISALEEVSRGQGNLPGWTDALWWGVWALETEPHHTRHEKPERRGREWEMPVFRNASLPIKQELLAFKAENEPRNKRLLCPENGCWGNHLCKG